MLNYAKENRATALIHRVACLEGQEITIHVGDEPTGFLPREIYDTFAPSDALALECDPEALYELTEEKQQEVNDILARKDEINAELLKIQEEYEKENGSIPVDEEALYRK